jgi:hypothetical protein
MDLTRRRFIFRAAAAVGGAITYVVLPPASAFASSGCLFIDELNPICTSGTTGQCRVRFGPPVCTGASSVTVYSPSDDYELFCEAECPASCGDCVPEVWQARGAADNLGECSCTVAT